jgi:hypothetical protein
LSAFSDLIHWLEYTGVHGLDPQDINKMLHEALTELKAGASEEHREALFVVHTVLTQARSGQDPLPGLRFLAQRYQRVAVKNEEPFGLALERKVREVAQQLEGLDWQVGAFCVLQEALQAHHSQGPDALFAVVQELDELLLSAWEPYRETTVTEAEVTAETVVGHRVLKDGFDCWFQALDEVELAVSESHGFENALALAEEGNRLLVAVQQTDSLRL